MKLEDLFIRRRFFISERCLNYEETEFSRFFSNKGLFHPRLFPSILRL